VDRRGSDSSTPLRFIPAWLRARLGSLLLIILLTGLLALLLLARCAEPEPLDVSGGFDYYSGPAGQIDRSALASVDANLGAKAGASLSALRYDDTRVGRGSGAIVGFGYALAGTGSLRAWGSRFVGDQAFRAWRLKAGPHFGGPLGVNAGFYYSHYENNIGDRSDGAIAEAGMPLGPKLTGRASAAVANVVNQASAAEAALGLTWWPARVVALSADVGLARQGVIGAGPPASGPLGLPLPGGPPSSGEPTIETRNEPTYQLGMRVMLP
jgi:hypothetical protein